MRFKIAVLFTLFSLLPLTAQNLAELQFRNQPVRDILMVLAEVTGRSIIADETVTGQATYLFNDMDLDTALDQFLNPYGYFYRKEGSTYHVSRIRIESSGTDVTFVTEETDLQLVIKRLSRELGVTILHDALPREKVTINYVDGSLDQLLTILIKPFPQFYLEAGDNYFYLRKESASSPSRGFGGPELFKEEGGLYSGEFQQVRFRDALAALMKADGREYAFLGRNDDIIEHFAHYGRTFDEMLALVLERGNSSFHESGGVTYILDLDRQDILKQYFATIYIPLEHISTKRLTALIPASLGSSGSMKSDDDNNAVLLNGTLGEIAPLEAFIRSIDKPLNNGEYRRYDLQFTTVDEFLKRLSPGMDNLAPVALGENSFLAALTEERDRELREYMLLADRPESVYPLKLAYLDWDTLKDNLPPTVNSDQLHPTGDPSLVFFRGSEGQYKALTEQLAVMDQPRPQIRYEILVLQIEDSQGLNLDSSLSISATDAGASTGFSGTLAGLASLTFDVVNRFGYQFAASLSANLSQNRSRVLADTTLHGLSGEQIRFQNTNTSRHPTTAVDADTGETEVTGFREITSGLIVDMEGWVSGDGMITMDVQSTISSQTSSSDSDSDSIPTTSEKIINTHVRTPSGESVILSGLKQRETVTEVKKVPFLGSIPLLGLLFQNRTETLKNTEFLITLIPYEEEEKSGVEDPYGALYNRFALREGDR